MEFKVLCCRCNRIIKRIEYDPFTQTLQEISDTGLSRTYTHHNGLVYCELCLLAIEAKNSQGDHSNASVEE